MVTNPVRRTILSVLADEERMTRTELAAVLATDEDIPAADTQPIEIDLHHNHLPKLAHDSYIEYDARTGAVILWKDPERVRAQLPDE